MMAAVTSTLTGGEWDMNEGEYTRAHAFNPPPDPLAEHFPRGTGGAHGGREGTIDRDLDRWHRHNAQVASAWRRIKYGPYRTFAALRTAAKSCGYVGALDTRSDMTRRLMLRCIRDYRRTMDVA